MTYILGLNNDLRLDDRWLEILLNMVSQKLWHFVWQDAYLLLAQQTVLEAG